MRRAALLVCGAMIGCAPATEIVVEVATDVRCADLKGATITVGRLGAIEERPVAAESLKCDESNGRIGRLVITPSGNKGEEVALKVIAGLGKPVADCTAGGPGCIVSRRALRFLKGKTVTLSVQLAAVCEGVPCESTQTCSAGKCVDARDQAAIDGATLPFATECGDMAGVQKSAPWPMFRGCPTHIARSPLLAPKTVRLRWKVKGEKWLRGGITLAADGTLYAATGYRGKLRAISPSGFVRWTSDIESMGGPAILSRGDRIVTNNGKVLSTSDGRELGAVEGGYGAAVVDARGRLYFSGIGSWTHAYDAQLKLLWAYPTAGNSYGPASLDRAQRTLFVPSVDEFVHAIDVDTGKTIFKAARGPQVSGPDATPTIGNDGTLFVPGTDGVHLIAPDGAAIKTVPPTMALGGAVATDGTVYVSSGSLFALTPDGTLKWRKGSQLQPAALAVVDREGVAIVGRDTGDLVAYAPDGAQLWSVSTGAEGITSEATIGPGRMVYVIGGDGDIYAFGPDE